MNVTDSYLRWSKRNRFELSPAISFKLTEGRRNILSGSLAGLVG